MDIVTISFLSALEVALLLAAVAVFLNRKNRRLQQQLEDARQPESSEEEFESISSGYLPYLEKQIIDTRMRYELLESESGVDERLAAALTQRLALLEAEKKVTESCNDYPKHRWEHVVEQYSPAVEEPEPADETTATTDQAVSEEQGSVDELVSAFGQQGEALTSLRTVFEQAREQPDSESLDKLEKQLGELERRFREANTCVEIMEQENQRLQQRMEQEEQRMESERNEDAVEFAQQMGKQKESISTLHDMIGSLQLEAEKAAELQEQIQKFENNAREMNVCIEIMEEENEFLRDQVQALLQMDREQPQQEDSAAVTGGEQEQSAGTLQAELEATRESMAALELKFAEMEKEYLLLYEKSQAEEQAGSF